MEDRPPLEIKKGRVFPPSEPAGFRDFENTIQRRIHEHLMLRTPSAWAGAGQPCIDARLIEETSGP